MQEYLRDKMHPDVTFMNNVLNIYINLWHDRSCSQTHQNYQSGSSAAGNTETKGEFHTCDAPFDVGGKYTKCPCDAPNLRHKAFA